MKLWGVWRQRKDGSFNGYWMEDSGEIWTTANMKLADEEALYQNVFWPEKNVCEAREYH